MNRIRETLYNERWYHVEEHYEPGFWDWGLIKYAALLLAASWAFLAAFAYSWPWWIGALA